ncbi:MAG TPA: response regulator [Nitrososphaeraceae archaeon]|nr:response regulator [Nitrososphaeraceae archaeon]
MTIEENVKMFTTKGKNILIIDDDQDITNLFQIFLEYNGYRVNAFTDPIDALYSFRRNVYDLVLLDLKMPKINGMLLYQKLKNIDPDLLFCFITANKEYIEHLKKSNSNIEKIVIYKPIHLSELRDKIHLILANHEQQDKKQLLMIL